MVKASDESKIKSDMSTVNPQTYEPKTEFTKEKLPLYSFGYRFEERVFERSPGPHIYPREEIEDFKLSRTSEYWRKTKSSSFGT